MGHEDSRVDRHPHRAYAVAGKPGADEALAQIVAARLSEDFGQRRVGSSVGVSAFRVIVMLAVWTALIGVIAGGLVSLASTLIQQQRTWRREDQIRTETKAIEQRRDERREVLKLFTEFLTACNRANVAYALPGTSSQPAYDQVQSYRNLIAERWAAVQGAGVVFMAVGHDQPTREAISGLIDATETLTVKLRRLDQPSEQDMADFSARRKECERAMRDYLARLASVHSSVG